MNYSLSHKLIALFILIVSISWNVDSQNNDFENALSHIKNSTPTAYKQIDSVLKPFERDSIKMRQFLETSKRISYNEGSSYALNALGVINRNISKYDESIKLHLEAKDYAEKAESDELKIISLNMIGVAYRRTDIIKPALDYHTEALKIAYSVINPSETITYNIAVSQNSIGNIYLALKQYEMAINQFNKSLEIERRADNKLGLAINYHNIGYAKEALGDLDTALINYKKSLNYNNAIDSEIGRVICYNSIGGIYLKKENYKDAEPIIRDALEKALKLDDQFYISSTYLNLGQLEMALGQNSLAEQNLKKALDIAASYNLKSSVAESSKLLSEINQEKKNYKVALEYYQKAVEIENTILTEQNLQYVNDIALEYENEDKNNQIKALASENEAVMQRLERNKKILLYTSLSLVILGIVLFILNRTKALKRDKHILTLEQDMLRSQMNPHFIFNSLNSIKLYIINNEKENAVYYLNKFSKLIRKILMASKEKETSLHDELETMKLYMNIENIRFSNEIDFKITVDESINTEITKVPSLVLQPFLENALWHGLSSKSNDKKIELNVIKKSSGYITVEIIDNGIGRIASRKIQNSKKLKRKSVGIDITKARLANFSKAFLNSYILEIEDLYENDNPSGTKIILQIPTNKLKTKALRLATKSS
ncbi:tetratricopeptide repeat protein [Winogradskyella echinorum]|uniref:Tetratricopeptide repeat protein n=1 Tax=Winogradskyella echinorum TaxID=538189 RepID=A0ABR6XZY9_9FLAO|nr:tetratricopeptide repeat protein [Winogradskyella echinorum]MBC3846030.1 tetratricopeptide repeat protein [Winogradskyella echinorum]MBC5750378.1 tetratricopeptide repeat protein [Winogradskyella echinorum]